MTLQKLHIQYSRNFCPRSVDEDAHADIVKNILLMHLTSLSLLYVIKQDVFVKH